MSKKADNSNADDKGVGTTGHEWDGIQEWNNPLPKWWLYTFYITIVWALIYSVLYPAWPGITGATPGILGYSTRAEVAQEIAAVDAQNAEVTAKLIATDVEEVPADAELMHFAQAGGAAVFRTYCSQCHGAGAAGAKGYPNLLDDDWLWGGTLYDIHETITYGIRYEQNEDTRLSEMPAFGRDELLLEEEIETVADYVLSLSGAGEASPEGEELFLDNCASCHGDEGMGEPALGAPNLTDAIWLYGDDKDTLVETITNSRAGVMPAWDHFLNEAQIKQVSVYVHSLGGGE